MTRKVRILDVAYNASNNELVRTQTLVKGAIIQVDAAPFKQWYQQHYGVEVGVKKRGGAAAAVDGEEAAAAQSNHVKRKLKQRNQGRKLDQLLDDQFATGRLYAAISSRPGQVRRCTHSYVLIRIHRFDGQIGNTCLGRGGWCKRAPSHCRLCRRFLMSFQVSWSLPHITIAVRPHGRLHSGRPRARILRKENAEEEGEFRCPAPLSDV